MTVMSIKKKCFMSRQTRAVASLSLPGGQDKNFSSIFPHFPLISLIFPQIFLIFFLNLVFRVGGSPTREGPGYATETDLPSSRDDHTVQEKLQWSVFLCSRPSFVFWKVRMMLGLCFKLGIFESLLSMCLMRSLPDLDNWTANQSNHRAHDEHFSTLEIHRAMIFSIAEVVKIWL